MNSSPTEIFNPYSTKKHASKLMHSPRSNRLTKIFASVHVLILLGYIGLLATANWHADEYITIFTYQQKGISFLWERITSWSPRPFSEILIYLYATLVNSIQLQLIPVAMGAAWGGLLISIALSTTLFLNTSTPSLIRLLLALTPITLTLAGAKTGEVFYWPMGSLAYLPTISAITVMTSIMIWGDITSHKITWLISTSILSTSSEMGAFFIFFFFSFSILSCQIKPINTQTDSNLTQWIKYTTPAFILAVFVIYGLLAGRVGDVNEAKMGPNIAHNLNSAIILSIPEVFRQIIGGAQKNDINNIPYFLIKIIFGSFVISLVSIHSPIKKNKSAVLFCTGLAAASTIGLTIFAAFYQFGILCCQRHDTARFFLSLILIITFAAVLSTKASKQTSRQSIKFAITGLILLIVVAILSTKKLLPDYKNSLETIETRNENWLFNKTTPSNFYIDQTKKHVTTSASPELGKYSATQEAVPIFNLFILKFFNLREIHFTDKHELSSQNMQCTLDKFQLVHNHDEKTGNIKTQITASGWMNLESGGLNFANTQQFLYIKGDDLNAPIYISFNLSERPDVAQHYRKKNLLKSGYEIQTTIPVRNIYEIGITAIERKKAASCQIHKQ